MQLQNIAFSRISCCVKGIAGQGYFDTSTPLFMLLTDLFVIAGQGYFDASTPLFMLCTDLFTDDHFPPSISPTYLPSLPSAVVNRCISDLVLVGFLYHNLDKSKSLGLEYVQLLLFYGHIVAYICESLIASSCCLGVAARLHMLAVVIPATGCSEAS